MRYTLWPRAVEVLDVPDTTRLRYAACRPPDDLAGWIESVALLEVPAGAPARRWRLVPDGRARLVLPLDDPGRGVLLQPPVWAPATVGTPPTGAYLVLRFTPWANGPLALVRDHPLGWWRQIHGGVGPFEAVAPLREAVRSRTVDRRAARAWQTLACDPDTLLEGLAGAGGTSPRTLLRSIRAASGCSLRQARNLERVGRALRQLRRDLSLSWTRAALDAGFYDQAHFVRMFRRLVGVPPTRFFEEGHHHLNDVFAERTLEGDGSLVVAVASPRLHHTRHRRPLARDGRRRSSEPRNGTGALGIAGPR